VEVGCGDGSFLRKLVIEGAGNVGYGIDPSYIGRDTDLEGRLVFEKKALGDEHVDLAADVVVCRHVIEHVPEPLRLLRAIRRLLENTDGGRVFLETPSVEWILRNQIIWDFFYEHCSYFHMGSLVTALEATGFEIQSTRVVFGDQYMWLEAFLSEPKPSSATNPGEIPRLAEEFAKSEGELLKDWKHKIRSRGSEEKIALWGAGAKGVTLANLVDPEREWIDCVVDINPEKQGHFIPGTGHPIVDYRRLAERGVTAAILLNPMYRGENLALLRQAHLKVELIDH
jgi:SAM-dependent methyltransferase